MTHDTRWMRRALRLAQKAEGQTRPNPPVGAVVVKDGRVIGEGFHARAGLPHAEVVALDACRTSPRGATLYVTLEPCSTTGRTPPCTERIIRDNIKRVVVGCPDPSPRHAGAGLAQLAEAGIEVIEGICREHAEDLIAPFAKHITTGLPFVTLKLALTLDGHTADRVSSSKWITGEKARAEVQRMRRRADAVMVGAGTVLVDDPSLLCRLPGGGELMRVIVDGYGMTPPTARVLTDDAAARTVVATLYGTTGKYGTAGNKHRAWKAHGARVWAFRCDKQANIPLHKLMKRLGEEGCLHVLCEGGAELAGILHDAGLIDEYAFFYAPAVLGDMKAFGSVEGRGTLLADMKRLTVKTVQRFGDDILVRVRSRKTEDGKKVGRRRPRLAVRAESPSHSSDGFQPLCNTNARQGCRTYFNRAEGLASNSTGQRPV